MLTSRRRTASVLVPLLTALLALGLLTPASAGATPITASQSKAWRSILPARYTVGLSVGRRPIVAVRQGPADAPFVVLVIGQMHGDEPRGPAVVAALRALKAPGQVQLWTIATMNPDGSRLNTRRNARRVDLNRNFPYHWSRTYPGRLYYPGARPASEPETRAMLHFLDLLQPDLIISLHQHGNAIDASDLKTSSLAYRLSKALNLRRQRVSCIGPCRGTLTGWYNATHAGRAITVEMPAYVPNFLAARYAKGILGVASVYAPPAPAPVPPTTPTVPVTPSTP